MNIAISINKIIYGGGERVLLMLMEEFSKQGHKIFVLTDNHSIQNELPYDFILISRSNFYNQVINLKRKLIECDIDLLIAFGFPTNQFLAAKLSKTKTIFSLRIDPLLSPGGIAKFTSKLVMNYCTGLVFQTNKVRAKYSKKIQNKSIVIPNPILDDYLPEISKNRKKVIVAVGRLSEEKNFELLINAFSNLIEANITDYTLQIYGDGPLKSKLMEQTRQLNLSNQVHFIGQIERVVDKIKDAQIFVLSSNLEGMPNALIEALSMGLACISTTFPTGAAEELITHRKNGLLIPTNSEKKLTSSLIELIQDTDLRNKIQFNAVEIRDRLDKKTIIPMWLNFISNIK